LIVYADTGFLVSLYGQDNHSDLATAMVSKKPVFVLTPLGEAELTNAMELRVFRKDWSRSEARSVYQLFLQHLALGVFRPTPITPEIWERMLLLSRCHSARLGTRTLDLLHVATALVLKPDAFYTFDERQRKVARAEHIRVLPS
jgi:predicted nucleic acid-binding protein